MVSLWLLLLACTTLSTLDGAKTLRPGTDQASLAMGLQSGGNALSSASGLPLPQLEVGFRHGLAENLDAGIRLYLVGGVADVRYRFYQSEDWHVAFAPGLGGLVVPLPGTAMMSAIDMRLPVIIERDLGPRLSLAGGPSAVGRWTPTWITTPYGSGSITRVDLLTGGNLRLRVGGERVSLGVGGDAYLSAARAGRGAWSAGFDLQARTQGRD
jgi:hypothetical protein